MSTAAISSGQLHPLPPSPRFKESKRCRSASALKSKEGDRSSVSTDMLFGMLTQLMTEHDDMMSTSTGSSVTSDTAGSALDSVVTHDRSSPRRHHHKQLRHHANDRSTGTCAATVLESDDDDDDMIAINTKDYRRQHSAFRQPHSVFGQLEMRSSSGLAPSSFLVPPPSGSAQQCSMLSPVRASGYSTAFMSPRIPHCISVQPEPAVAFTVQPVLTYQTVPMFQLPVKPTTPQHVMQQVAMMHPSQRWFQRRVNSGPFAFSSPAPQ